MMRVIVVGRCGAILALSIGLTACSGGGAGAPLADGATPADQAASSDGLSPAPETGGPNPSTDAACSDCAFEVDATVLDATAPDAEAASRGADAAEAGGEDDFVRRERDGRVKLSTRADGRTLAAISTIAPGADVSTRSAKVFDVASGSVLGDFPVQSDEALTGLKLNAGGTRLSLVYDPSANPPFPELRRFQVTDVTGQTTFLDDTEVGGLRDFESIQLLEAAPYVSPNGQISVVPEGAGSTTAIAVYEDGGLVFSKVALPIGWVDDNVLLAQEFSPLTSTSAPTQMMALDPTGNVIANWPVVTTQSIVEDFDVISPSLIYARNQGIIYNATTGAMVETVTGLPAALSAVPTPAPGVVAGHAVIYTTDDSILAVRY